MERSNLEYCVVEIGTWIADKINSKEITKAEALILVSDIQIKCLCILEKSGVLKSEEFFELLIKDYAVSFKELDREFEEFKRGE